MMKKIISFIVGAVICTVMITPVFANQIDENSDDKMASTLLTAKKEASYIVVIPETAELAFNTEKNFIGSIRYESGNLEPGACVTVELTGQTDLVESNNENYKMEYAISDREDEFQSVTFTEESAPGSEAELYANISPEAWKSAKAGNYEAKLTFTISYTNTEAK